MKSRLPSAWFAIPLIWCLVPGLQAQETGERGINVFSLPVPNTSEREFSPVMYQDRFLFVSSRFGAGMPDPVTGEAYFDLFAMPMKKGFPSGRAKSFSPDLNTNLHEGPCCFSSDGKTIYFTRSNQDKGSPVLDSRGKIQLQVCQASWNPRGFWENAQVLPLHKGSGSCMHPSLSPNGEKLYFASDRPGGYGGFDIYFSEKEDGAWSDPVNLGPEINSSGNEAFPYMPGNGVLFFASNGHEGLGGLDLFMIDISSNRWGPLLNLGTPINSAADDFGIVLKDYTSGFFSTNRPGGRGKDDLYGFSSVEPLTGVLLKKNPAVPQLQFFDQRLGATVAEVQVNFVDAENVDRWDRNYVSNEAGLIRYQPFFDEDRWLVIQKNGYQSQEILLEKQVLGEEPRSIFILLDSLVSKPSAAPMLSQQEEPPLSKPTPMPKTLTLDNLYYPYNDFKVPENQRGKLDELAGILRENSGLRIRISAHTDARGSFAYNRSLSLRRATAIQDYLIARGAAAWQIKVQGLGESFPRNPCIDGVACSETDHAYNRRVEFTLLEN